MGKLKKDEHLSINSMGKRFTITGLFLTDDEANHHTENHRDEGVIAEIQGVIFVANLFSAESELENVETDE